MLSLISPSGHANYGCLIERPSRKDSGRYDLDSISLIISSTSTRSPRFRSCPSAVVSNDTPASLIDLRDRDSSSRSSMTRCCYHSLTANRLHHLDMVLYPEGTIQFKSPFFLRLPITNCLFTSTLCLNLCRRFSRPSKQNPPSDIKDNGGWFQTSLLLQYRGVEIWSSSSSGNTLEM